MALPDGLSIEDLCVPEYEALVLQGSYARGDYIPTSDVDIHVICPTATGAGRRLQIKEVNGLKVEIHITHADAILHKLEQSPGWVHSWLRAEHLDGDEEITQSIQERAKAILADYTPTPKSMRSTVHWLESVSSKLSAARQAADQAYAGFLAATSTWELLSGLWHANQMPIPSASLVYRLTPQLGKLPPRFDEDFTALCSGDTHGRAEAFLRISRWVVAALDVLLDAEQGTLKQETSASANGRSDTV